MMIALLLAPMDVGLLVAGLVEELCKGVSNVEIPGNSVLSRRFGVATQALVELEPEDD